MPGMQGNHLPPTEGPRLDSGTLKLFAITRSFPYELLEEESPSLYRGVQLTKEVILSGPLSWLCDIVPA